MNLAMLDGIRSGVGETDRWPRPVTIPGACCVAFGASVEADAWRRSLTLAPQPHPAYELSASA